MNFPPAKQDRHGDLSEAPSSQICLTALHLSTSLASLASGFSPQTRRSRRGVVASSHNSKGSQAAEAERELDALLRRAEEFFKSRKPQAAKVDDSSRKKGASAA
jgi:hypothetical protein